MLRRHEVGSGEDIIIQGSEGDNFYIVEDISILHQLSTRRTGVKTCLESFPEALRFVLSEYEPVASHGRPSHASFHGKT